MLTVVGIIAVLVSVSIPVVNSSLKKAQVATDAANERAAKGALMMESLLADGSTGVTPTDPDGYLFFDNAAGQWKTDPPSTAYGKCDDHKDCYLKGKMLDSGVVRIVWVDETDITNEKATLCSGEMVAEDSGGGSTPPIVLSDPAPYGEFMVQAQNLATDVTFNNAVLTIKNGATVVICNQSSVTQTKQRIEVEGGIKATNITLAGVNINASGGAAFKIEDNSTGDVTIILEGTNILESGKESAGLQKNGGDTSGTLTIMGSGSLTAKGGEGGAGIGGGYSGNGSSGDCSNIIISGGTVTAIGKGLSGTAMEEGGAGIGGGYSGNGSHITISGGTVTATSENSGGAGIGGGCSGNGSNIIISGGIVTATCKNSKGYGAGIGGGFGGNGSGITISGGTVTAKGGVNAAGIGGGLGGEGTGNGSDITINITQSGDKVETQGGDNGEDIGNGKDGSGGSGITVNGLAYTNRKTDGSKTIITKETKVIGGSITN